MRVLCVALMVLMGFADGAAQSLSKKLDPRLKMLVSAVRSRRPVLSKVTGADQQLIQVYIKGQANGVRDGVMAAGGQVGTVVGDMVTARVPLAALETMAAHPAVVRVEQAEKKTAYNDNSVALSGVLPVQIGASPLRQTYTGKGVLVGIIETGIDIRHLDFRDPQDPGKSRILALWDQNDRRGPQPEGFDYGTLWTQADIEATLAGANVVRHQDRIGHGTHVSGTAVGNGSAVGAYRGVAPEADILFVNGIDNVVDAVSYIFGTADLLGRPVAINYSAGDHLGPHDGTTLEEQMLDALIEAAPGRVMVAAAGNQGDGFMHWGGFNLGADSVWTFYRKDIFNTDLIADEAIGYIGPIDAINGVVYNTDAANTFVAVGLDSVGYGGGSVQRFGYHGQSDWVSLKDLADREDVVTDTLRYRNGEIADAVAANRVGERVDGGQTGDVVRYTHLLNAGTYVIVVSSVDGASAGAYTLSADDFGAIALGETQAGRLVVSDEVAYYRLDLDQATDMILSLSPVEDNLDMVLTLYKGTLISDASQVNWVGFPIDEYVRGWPEHWVGVLDPGRYLVAVSSFRGRSAGSFTLEFDTIHPLSLGERQAGRLPASNFWDFYRLDLTADTEVVLSLTPDVSLNAVADIFRGTSLTAAVDDNRVNASLDGGGTGEVERFEGVLTAGSYLIWVSSFEGDSAGAYALRVLEKGAPLLGDFDGDGRVNFTNFISFAQHFGTLSSDANFDARFDMDQNGAVGFPDFIVFTQNFGG